MNLQEIAQTAQIVSTAAVIVSALTAITVLSYTRRANRRRATLDFVMKTFVDDSGRTTYDKFIALTRRAADQSHHFTFLSLETHSAAVEEDRNVVIDQMNTYELVALGIRNGVFDDAFFKHWYHGQFMRDYKAVEELLKAVRKDRPSVFCEAKWLYDRWERKQHPVNNPGLWKKGWWLIRRDNEKLRAALK